MIKDGNVAYRGAFGVRGARLATAIDTRTLFMVGSITKSMTSTMVATLVDDGLVTWDTPVEQLLPTFALAQPEYEGSVTLRHLLSHRSGLSRSDVSLFLGSERPLELIDEVSTIPMLAPPGQRYEYQNQAYSFAVERRRRATPRAADHAHESAAPESPASTSALEPRSACRMAKRRALPARMRRQAPRAHRRLASKP